MSAVSLLRLRAASQSQRKFNNTPVLIENIIFIRTFLRDTRSPNMSVCCLSCTQLSFCLWIYRTGPIAVGGSVALGQKEGLSEYRLVRLRQLQLEQDTGKTLVRDSADETVLIDLNRAGCGLLEIVTYPDMRWLLI